MVTALSLRSAALRLPVPRNGVSWAIGFSVLLHIALGWYFVSRLMMAHTIEPEPLPIPVDFQQPIAPPKPPPPPEVETDKTKAPRKIRHQPTQREVKPVEGAAKVDASPIEAGPSVEAGPIAEPAPAVPAAAPRPTKRVQPDYPEKAATAGKSGEVQVYVVVSPGGAVTDVQVVREEPKGYGFGRAAVGAVRRWEFADATPGTYSVTVKFRMND